MLQSDVAQLKADPTEIESRASDLAQASLFIDVSALKDLHAYERLFTRMIGKAAGQVSPERVHVLTPFPVEEARVHSFRDRELFAHVVVCQPTQLEEAAVQYARVLRRRAETGSGALSCAHESLRVALKHSKEKKEATEAVHAYLSDHGFRDRVATMLATVADELILNAIFDAAVLAGHAREYESQSGFELSGQSAVEVLVTCDQDEGTLSVIDHFGTLSRESVFRHVLKGFRSELAINPATPTVGIGLANVARMGFSLAYETEQGRKTRATALFRKTQSFTSLRDGTRFVSVSERPL